MNKIFFTLLSFLCFIGYNYSQIRAEVEGTTITEEIAITNGAATGYILQSTNANGLAQWVNPSIFMGGGGADNLGNHIATMNLSMNSFGIDRVSFLEFPTGAIFSDDGSMGLAFSGSQIDYNGAQLVNARSLSFAASGGDSFIAEFPAVSGVTQTEILIWSNSGNEVPVGIGGPVNPPPGNPIASVIGNAGLQTIPSAPFMLGVHGDAWALDWYALSDARFKKNIKPINRSLDKIKQIKAVTYRLDKDKFVSGEVDDSQTIGFLAQDLASILPEAVKTNANGVKLVRYNAVIPVLADAIKELDEQVTKNTQLQSQLSQLQKENKFILTRLSKLEAQLENK